MLPVYVLIDLETTGATPDKDRITEIGLIRYEDGIEVSRWQTLINPEIPISSFIEGITGISNAMVHDAPLFQDVANELLSHLQGAVLCAHNVRFDHGFLRREFKRLGITLQLQALCTIKLSRLLYPVHKSHGLDAIINRHAIHCEARHRAMGDVEVVAEFLRIAAAEHGMEHLRNTAATLLQHQSPPADIHARLMDEMPESPGVYCFHGENSLSLYVGKSTNIRRKAMSHFNGEHVRIHKVRITQAIQDITWTATAGEFGAALLEANLVRQHHPIHNRFHTHQLYTWHLASAAEQLPLLKLVTLDDMTPEMSGQFYGAYRSIRQATAALRQMAEAHSLCPQWLGLEDSDGPCFAAPLKRCKGVCCGREAPTLHYLRLQQALINQQLKPWPYPGKIGIREPGSGHDKTDIHIFDHWCHLGTVDNISDLEQLGDTKATLQFDFQVYKLLLKELSKPCVQLLHL
ncbi:DNA polymerase-3 subunit epsilon [Methylobacillus rhizosphaerae]|uniref:DNA-directed DNA polymerase n=1 Tax=Methylobacillus rhizosphaerae TaxID=551994 RepID=A0A238ZRX6_9PROT|nr:exonuclease domain-containing protein [Methylobacillus rhizosphaerae]SNR85484.1 DNA polymerase-3 subunit epsilon [Methylobacillus rhizosphaerae]